MSNLLLRQFIEPRSWPFAVNYVKIMGMKTSNRLNMVIPDVSINLLNSAEAFVDGLIGLD
jgi:hypothetical protein